MGGGVCVCVCKMQCACFAVGDEEIMAANGPSLYEAEGEGADFVQCYGTSITCPLWTRESRSRRKYNKNESGPFLSSLYVQLQWMTDQLFLMKIKSIGEA